MRKRRTLADMRVKVATKTHSTTPLAGDSTAQQMAQEQLLDTEQVISKTKLRTSRLQGLRAAIPTE